MKKRLIASLLLLILTSCSTNSIKFLADYQKSIDYSCKTNADCIKKDIGNCCGYYPKCVNKNFQPNRELVSQLCQSEKLASVCGYQEITSCNCINNKCEGIQ